MFTTEEAAVTFDLQNPTSSFVECVTIPKEFVRPAQQNVTFDPQLKKYFSD